MCAIIKSPAIKPSLNCVRFKVISITRNGDGVSGFLGYQRPYIAMMRTSDNFEITVGRNLFG
jgi:hypothetical protein